MKIKNLLCLSTLLASLCGAEAATTLTAWTFDNDAIGINSSPSTSTGIGAASALGMSNTYNNTNSVSNPDIYAAPAGSSSGGPNAWRIRGFSSTTGSKGNGWSTNAPIGTQGAQFTANTFGYYKMSISFDVYATSDAEANLQVQYTMNGGTNWVNATITSVGSGASIHNNTSSANTVIGSYAHLQSGWNNQITADLTGVSAVDNNINFGIRVVNASTGTDCVDTTGAVYNNKSGSWTLDNVSVQGNSIDYVAAWPFDGVGTIAGPTNTFPAIIGFGTATAMGMDNSYNNTNSITACDVLAQGGASTGAGSYCWRVRGNGALPNAGNGWSTQAPLGTQGAEFDADTSGYTNVICTFDVYSTSAAEGKLCVLYTTDGTTWNVAPTLYYSIVPSFVHTNSSSANTVSGTYVFWTSGQNWYNDMVIDFSSIPATANNPNFGIRIVNAATGADCLNATGGAYNNTSGNWRFDNVVIGGTSGNPAPTVNYAPNATVDNPFTNTFADNATWRSKIYAVYVNGVVLTNSAYTNYAGQLVFNPSKSALLQSSGLLNISINATGFGTARYSQPLASGVATKIAVTTQAAGPTASGGTLTANPQFLISDQYGNGTTNPYATVSIVASVGGSGGWTLGGDTTQSNVNGVIAFTNLSATLNGSSAISGAYITFAVSGYPGFTTTNSPTFSIGVAPVNFTPGNLAVLQLDQNANNTTFSILELKPSAAGQSGPLNIVPISATGTNGLRMSSAGSCGKLSLSDDGTFACFAAFLDQSAATPDETFNLNRMGAGVGYNVQVTNALSYTSTSLGGSQARSAVALNNNTWIVDDKGGLYGGNPGGPTIADPNYNPYNNVVVRSFGGTPYVETQKAVAGLTIPVVYTLAQDDNGNYTVTLGNNLTTDGNASDFYVVSTNGGATYDILYILDGLSSTSAQIVKYSYVNGNWVNNGVFANSTGGDSLFATTNGTGSVYLYYTTGASKSNSLVRVTDAGGWNAPIHIVSSNVLYTATGNTYLKGITFVPQQNAYASQLIPPPILIANTITGLPASLSVTNTPDDSAWRSAISQVYVNGNLVPVGPGSCDTTQPGKIVFYPAQNPSIWTTGANTITIAANGYSTDAVVQTVVAPAFTSLQGTYSASSGNFSLSFTGTTGLGYSVLSTNTLTAPKSTWPVVGAAVESPAGSGSYHYTNSAANAVQQFYILRQP